MKDEKWIIYLIVGFTSITTVLLLADGTFLGFARAIVAAAVLDGLIAYWDNKRVTLKSEEQRTYSNRMMWAGVGIMLVFAAGYGVEVFAPVDAVRSVDVFGYTFTMSLKEFILMLAASLIGGWVVLTLGVVLYMRQIDPDIQKELEHTKALAERDNEEMTAYKTALKVTARQIGTEKALNLFKSNLKQDGYTEVEVNRMVEEARTEIQVNRGEIIPVDAIRAYNAETANFTQPSTPKK